MVCVGGDLRAVRGGKRRGRGEYARLGPVRSVEAPALERGRGLARDRLLHRPRRHASLELAVAGFLNHSVRVIGSRARRIPQQGAQLVLLGAAQSTHLLRVPHSSVPHPVLQLQARVPHCSFIPQHGMS